MEDDVAIQTDVADEGTTGVTPPTEERQPVVSDRDRMMDLIDQQVDQLQDKQYVEAGLPPLSQQAAAPAATAATEPPAATLPAMVRVKVDGKEMEVPLEEVVAEFQKGKTGDQRLATAAQQLRVLEQERQSFQQLQTQLQAQTAQPSAAAAPDVDGAVQKVAEALVEGNPETATEALKELVTTLSGRQEATPPVDPNAIASQVKNQLDTEKDWADFATANPEFTGSYDKKTGIDTRSPHQKMGDYLFDTKYGPLVKSGQISYREALNQAADEVNQVFGQKPGPAADPPVNEREARKQKLDNLHAVNASRPAAAAQEQEESYDDIIAGMRKDRGLSA